MSNVRMALSRFLIGCLVIGCLAAAGCIFHKSVAPPAVPHELAMVPHPPYTVEPPDILLIDAIRLVPKPPYRIEPLDAIAVQAFNVPAEEPIQGLYTVSPDGTINLGFNYGVVHVAGLTIEEARMAIEKQLRDVKIKAPQVRVALGQIGGIQQIRGDHLVRMDGTIGLGIYGHVNIYGMTLDQARAAIQDHLSQYFLEPNISLDVYSYNSKYYYVIADGAGYGQQILRFQITGKETVLDAISQIYGLPLVSSKHKIWVARPNGSDCCKQTILPVDWVCLTEGGSTATNYQVMPNDRIYIQSQGLIITNNALAKAFAPLERVLGLTLLGSSAVQGVQQIGILARTNPTGNNNGLVTPSGNIIGR